MDKICATNDYSESLDLIRNLPSPRFPEYASFSKRFRSLNEFSSVILDKLKLAEAGFFLETKDSVQCWVCGIVLKNWIKGDCPFREHAKFSKKCSFMLLNKGSIFVNDVNNSFRYKDLNHFCTCDHTRREYDVIDG